MVGMELARVQEHVLNGPVNSKIIENKHTTALTDGGIRYNKHVKLAAREISQNKLRRRPEVYG
jgi:hypothetical protein